MKPAVITKVTGHIAQVAHAGDLRYLEATSGAAYYESRAVALLDHLIAVALHSQANGQFSPLTADEIRVLIAKRRHRTER